MTGYDSVWGAVLRPAAECGVPEHADGPPGPPGASGPAMSGCRVPDLVSDLPSEWNVF